MPKVVVQDVDDQTLAALVRLAADRGVSLQQELKLILEQAARASTADPVEVARRIREGFEKQGITFSDSAELLREDRQR